MWGVRGRRALGGLNPKTRTGGFHGGSRRHREIDVSWDQRWDGPGRHRQRLRFVLGRHRFSLRQRRHRQRLRFFLGCRFRTRCRFFCLCLSPCSLFATRIAETAVSAPADQRPLAVLADTRGVFADLRQNHPNTARACGCRPSSPAPKGEARPFPIPAETHRWWQCERPPRSTVLHFVRHREP